MNEKYISEYLKSGGTLDMVDDRYLKVKKFDGRFNGNWFIIETELDFTSAHRRSIIVRIRNANNTILCNENCK